MPGWEPVGWGSWRQPTRSGVSHVIASYVWLCLVGLKLEVGTKLGEGVECPVLAMHGRLLQK